MQSKKMGAKKKPAAKNDFYFFMQDQKKQLRRENYVWNTMEDLVQICSPRWKHLPESDRKRYKEMAKNYKKDQQNDKTNKYTSVGESLADTEREQRSKDMKLRSMLEEIEEMVANARKSGSLSSTKFFFIHINPLVELEEDQFLPCEIALLQYSLQKGISRIFHSYVKPAQIPIGYGFAIQTNVADKHKLDPDRAPMTEKSASSWGYIVKCLYNFINPLGFDGATPPLFTMAEDSIKTENMLSLLFDWGGQRMRRDLRIYHLHELFGAIAKHLNAFELMGNHDIIAASKLESDEHDLADGMACDYHYEVERASYCSLTRIKSWAYIVSGSCCPFADRKIEMKEGHHIPPQQLQLEYEEPAIIKYDEELYMSRWNPSQFREEPDEPELFSAPKTKAAAAGVIPTKLSNPQSHCDRPDFKWEVGGASSVETANAWAPRGNGDRPPLESSDFPALGAGGPTGGKEDDVKSAARDLAKLNVK